MNKAVFLDKDGTLIYDLPYNVDPARIELYADAGAALARLQAAGYQLIIVSNQSGVARGYFEEAALAAVEARLGELFAPYGVQFDGFYYCPHHPAGTVPGYAADCDCRKPAPGLLLRAAQAHQLDLGASWMIGDMLKDVEAGQRAGCRTILVDRQAASEEAPDSRNSPTATVASLREAADFIDLNI